MSRDKEDVAVPQSSRLDLDADVRRTPAIPPGYPLQVPDSIFLPDELLQAMPRFPSDGPDRAMPSSAVIPLSCNGRTIYVYGPEQVPDDFHFDQKEDEFRRVLAKIETIYREVEADLDSGSLESGYCCCLGLLNPKDNIRINGSMFKFNSISSNANNASSSSSSWSSSWLLGKRGGAHGGDRDMAKRSLDGLITFLTCLFPYLPIAEALTYLDAVDADPLAAAALIVARRGRNYCWMPTDPTIAAATMAMALKCGALAAQHPDPSLLVKEWTNLSHCLHQIQYNNTANFLHRKTEFCNSNSNNLEVQAVWKLADDRLYAKLKFSDDVGFRIPTGVGLPPVRGAMKRMLLAKIHGFYLKLKALCSIPKGLRLPPVREAMKRMLLAKIHGFYLKALGSLPKDELTERYHRAFVMGGYCYGPLQPAANIIVNMIWYEQNFPTTRRFKQTTMVGTDLLWRVASRSLYGLVSFLCTRYPSLTPDHAMQRLLVAEANLQVADPNLFDTHTPSRTLKNCLPFKNHTPSSSQRQQVMDWSGCPQIGSGGKDDNAYRQMKAVRKASVSVLEAYTAAATAAFHPSPSAQKEFLGSPDSVAKLKSASDMFRLEEEEDGRQLSSEEFDLLSMFLQRCRLSSVGSSTLHHQQQEPADEPKLVGRAEYAELTRRVHAFWFQHGHVSRMVLAALEKFNRSSDESSSHQYSLHVICSVNEFVSGPKFCPGGRVDLSCYPYIYQCYHINFLATRVDKKLDDDAQRHTRLFFAECNIDDADDVWCVPVDWSSRSRPVGGQARCFYCETHGNRIIHPALSVFHGFDFEEAFFGPDSKSFYNNDHMILLKSIFVDWVDIVEEEAIYTNFRLRDGDGYGNMMTPSGYGFDI